MSGYVGLSPAINFYIIRNNKKFWINNFPQLFQSVGSVRAEMRSESIANVTVTLTPSYEDAMLILKSGILGRGIQDKGQEPPPPSGNATSSVSSSSIPSGPVGSKPAAIGAPAAGSAAPKVKTLSPNTSYYVVTFFYNEGDLNALSSPTFIAMGNFPTIDFGDGQITITLQGAATEAHLDGIEVVKAFENESALDIIQKMADKVGIEVTFDKDDGETESKLSNNKKSHVFSASPFNIIRKVLADNLCAYTFIPPEAGATGGELRIKSFTYLYDQNPRHTFVVFRGAAVDLNVIPCWGLSISGSYGNLFGAQGEYGAAARGVDTGSKEFKKEVADSSSIEGKSAAGGKSTTPGAIPLDDGSASDVNAQGGYTPDDMDDEAAGKQIAGVFRGDDIENLKSDSAKLVYTSKYKAGLQYHFSCPGIPDIYPLDLATVLVGDVEDGLSATILVKKVTHVYDNNGWTTEIEAESNAGFNYDPDLNKRSIDKAPATTAGGVKSSEAIA